ncbi:type II toxin-antitoxin system HicB family antitoxin [Xenorhabdus bovienii]|uniref:Type II toxin-antitoxin system HicB family antitoxin n=1 Tax=Xenorhabdus bovienii TaxID=40576 RepID=A0AAJ1JBC9_XENBV|nr:type II toxin-antitoxin system HicB family antitoxin [Xenorhabdus bovienii]MDE1480620.1 type II toxin-antitoxin system HicB family antitoxin [Xenorhabdus bovienii]MDE1493087.1 type II toxin-antitoxin system HicB family antitoxin [Xenorhabdus bovienii]MDE9512335.1 type II toxin-antitoxin system HicB family antitoxin [Xenorhabdus bovienii]MDE9523974.1 type II toxin-antitoxin system HicB family antitoxin [Xenorhabdus bovienii]MDE9545353.1 type II toxin-antitoxin system HicB family antitoxin [X
MLYPIAIEIGDENHAYGVAVPDIPGCFSAGDSMEDAVKNAKEAITGHLELLAEMNQLPPEAKPLDYWIKDEEYTGWAWAVVDIDVEPYLGKSTKFNVTLPDLLSKKIDDQVKASPSLYKNRSHFLQVAALHELQNSIQQ